ncbi:unnamed protein product [Ilex paraguariensis]|uniref:TPX2 C-terminal domain-containing protein n=1 Tax=Ilex paraguariensis TaxID=185542 RepID=A0ABC8UKB8_9AQUA
MDTDNNLVVFGHENGVYKQLTVSGEGGVALEKINGTPNGVVEVEGLDVNFESVVNLNEDGAIDFSAQGVTGESIVPAESNGVTISKELELKEREDSKHVKSQKGTGKEKNGKPSSPKHAAPTWTKKSKERKDVKTASAVSNGSAASDSHAKQPFAMRTKSRSFNDHQAADRNSKPTPPIINAHPSECTGKSDAASSAGNVVQSDSLPEKTKLKTLKKGSSNKAEGSMQSSLSPTTGDAKSRKVGALPHYNFSFKCNERAEKRKEFYSKLEEKINAKEMEKSNMQAKTKESQEAEIKMLRKSLTFRATPMPSFYQEPLPPKAELKKIPPTRAKSPKLGRKKSSPPRDSEENSDHKCLPGRLSLDEKVSQNNPAKGPSSVGVKKPLRKSLPKLPSEKTSLSITKNDAKSQKTTSPNKKTNSFIEMNVAASHSQEQEAAPATESSETQPKTVDVSVVEDEVQTTSGKEPIALNQ